VLQRSKAAHFSIAQEARHVEILSVRKCQCMHHAEVDPDGRILTSSDGDGRLLDAEADMPAERILEQPGAGDSALPGVGRDRQGNASTGNALGQPGGP
jgi:hypothetical protein